MRQKYWAIFKHSFIQGFSFRSEILLWTISDVFPTLVLFYVWQAVFKVQASNTGYDLSKVIEFYFYFLIINNITSAHFEQERVQQIREGKIDSFFTRPLGYLNDIFVRYLANKCFYFLFLIPALILIYFISQNVVHVHYSSVSPSQLFQFLLLITLGFFIEFLMGVIIVLIGFWSEGAAGLEHFKWIVITMLGGTIAPKAFLPVWLRQIVAMFPFQYMYSAPIEVIQGLRIIHWYEVVYVLGLLGIEVLIAKTLWKKAIYQYTAVGG
jgi:ABC-2 type transport system permease protein